MDKGGQILTVRLFLPSTVFPCMFADLSHFPSKKILYKSCGSRRLHSTLLYIEKNKIICLLFMCEERHVSST